MTTIEEPPEEPVGDPVGPVSPDDLVDQDDPIDPDEVAEEAPVDPTPQEVDEYRHLIGDDPNG
ncbi:hypothetical protein ACRAKI_25420 [Saccharothrix isguenensis]